MDTLRQKIDRTRVWDSQDEATAEASEEKVRECQRREQIREQNRLLWIDHFERLAVGLRVRAEDYDRKAEALCKKN